MAAEMRARIADLVQEDELVHRPTNRRVLVGHHHVACDPALVLQARQSSAGERVTGASTEKPAINRRGVHAWQP